MESSRRLQNKLWQLAQRWLPPFYVPRKPGSQRPPADYNHWPHVDINFYGLLQELWKLSFSWLHLIFLPPVERDNNSGVKTYPKSFHIELPFSRQLANNVAFIVIGIFGVVYFTFFAGSAMPIEQANITAPPLPTSIDARQPGLGRSEPSAIRIPRIGINAPTNVELGLHNDGTMETPEAYEVVGWYKHAPTPGQLGPAILVGHVDNYLGAAVFYRLSELVVGDKIEIDREDGQTVKFVVDGLERYPQDNFPTQKVYGNLDYPGLRLITCGGQFNRLTGRYSDNTVVYARML